MPSSNSGDPTSRAAEIRASVNVRLELRLEQEGWQKRGMVEAATLREVVMLVRPEGEGAQHVQIGLVRIEGRNAAPWHIHENHEEFCHVLSGRGEFWTSTCRYEIGPGDTQLVAPGEPHLHRPVGDEPLVVLWGYAPPGPQLS